MVGLLSGLILGGVPSGFGQVPLNSQLDPGTLLNYSQRTLQSEEKRPQKVDDLTQPAIDVPPLPANGDQAEGPQFVLEAVRVNGVSVFSDEAITAVFGSYVGKTVDMETLMSLKTALTELYTNNGYMTSRAFLPPQEIEEGIVDIQVVEGRVDDVVVEGLERLRESYITERMAHLKGRVFRVQDLEAALRQLNQSRVVKAKATIRPGEHFGTSTIVLMAEEQRPWELTLFSDNQGRENVGFYRSGLMAQHHNLLGFGDSLAVNGVASLSPWGQDGSQSVFGTYTVPIGSKGLQIGTSISAGHVQVGGPLENLDINGRSYTLGAFLSGPLFQKEGHSAFWEAGFDSKRSLQFLGDIRFPTLGIPNTEIRTAHVGLTWLEQDKTGQTTLQQQVSQGLDALGGNSVFLKYNVDLTRIQSLVGGTYLIGRLGGQLTPNSLPSMEQFQAGGAQTVRGYQEGTIIGDQGYFASLEFRLPLSVFSPQLPRDFQLLSFVEAGAAGVSSDSIEGGTGNIRSAGVGIRSRLWKRLFGRIDAGFSFTDNQTEPTGRIHFGLSGNLL